MIVETLPVLRLANIDLRDQTLFGIADLSSYSILPTVYNLQLTAPGYETISVSFTPGQMNVYKCSDFGITCGVGECCPLPDGIYNVVYTVGLLGTETTVINKSILKVDQIKCKYSKMFLKIKTDCNCDSASNIKYLKYLKDVQYLITGSIAAANDCNPELAYSFYNKADSILNTLCCTFGLDCSSKISCPECQ